MKRVLKLTIVTFLLVLPVVLLVVFGEETGMNPLLLLGLLISILIGPVLLLALGLFSLFEADKMLTTFRPIAALAIVIVSGLELLLPLVVWVVASN